MVSIFNKLHFSITIDDKNPLEYSYKTAKHEVGV